MKKRRGTRDEDRLNPLLADGLERLIEVLTIGDAERDRRYAQLARRPLDLLRADSRRLAALLDQQADLGDPRHEDLQQLQPLAVERGGERGYAGEVAPWLREFLCQAKPHGVIAGRHYDRHLVGDLLRRGRCLRS